MASLKSLASGRSETYRIDPALITVDPNLNLRIEGPAREARIQEMVGMISAQGLLSPLVVRMSGEEVVVVAGHTRLAAIKLINEATPGAIQTVLCLQERAGTTDAERTMNLVTENDGQAYNPLEKAEAFKKLVNVFGWTEEQIAERSGISTKQVQNMLAITAASDAVKEIISNGEMSLTNASLIVQKVGADKATEVIKAAVVDAKAQGKAKATTKTMTAAAATPKVTSFASDLLGFTTPAPAPTPTPTATARPSADHYKELLTAVQSCLELDDLVIIHTVLRDTLLTIGVPIPKAA